jgi:hypothetical protein
MARSWPREREAVRSWVGGGLRLYRGRVGVSREGGACVAVRHRAACGWDAREHTRATSQDTTGSIGWLDR